LRRLATCALSCFAFLSLVGNAQAATHESAPFGLAAPAYTVSSSQYEVLASVTTEKSGSSIDVAAVPVIATQPASAFSDMLMWGVPTSKSVRTSSDAVHHAHGLDVFTAGIISRTRMLAARITESALHFIGTPYSFGGTTAAGFDCSGYVQHVFRSAGISLPRTADAQYLVGKHVDTAHAQRGDLVFFQTYTAGVSHVGIYLGNARFIHSSSSRGVTVSSLNEPYWSSRYLGAERILNRSTLDHALAKS
jgi:cell wall-associated NlpC family hydrolase